LIRSSYSFTTCYKCIIIPSNFLFTKTYGIAPSNTQLTVKYIVGGGAASNVAAETLTDISNAVKSFKYTNLDNTISNYVINSLAITNPEPAVGGGDGNTEDEIRLNTLTTFPAQLRAVTLDDYLIRSYSLPSKFGVISKAYTVQDSQIDNTDNNKLSLSIYVLSQGTGGALANASYATKQNLKTYLSQFRMLTDAVNIKDAFIVNIGVDFDIMVLPNYNSQEVILNCITALKEYLKTDKLQINQPIIISELYVLLDRIKGVQTVKSIEVTNKVGENLGYSKYAYDVKGAINNRVLYPSLDPCIFEVKYPDVDIRGRTSGY